MCVYEEREDGGGGWGGKSGRLSPNSFPRMPRRHSLKAELTRGRKKMGVGGGEATRPRKVF